MPSAAKAQTGQIHTTVELNLFKLRCMYENVIGTPVETG